MARVAGRDVILQLMDTTKQLRAEMDDVHRVLGEQQHLLERQTEQLDLHTARLDELSRGFAQLAENSRGLADHARLMTHNVAILGQSFKRMDGLVAQLGSQLAELDGRSKRRFEALEARVERLESKR